MATRDDELFERLLGEYVDRLNAGEKIDHDAILTEHPDLGPDLLREIETFEDFKLPDNSLAASAAQPLGTLGDYTLRRQIGRGGMAVVYEAWQGSLDRQVALKVLPAGIAADDKAFHRFMREAKTAAKLNHPHVVAVYGMGVEQNTPYYSMEFVEGETLAQVLSKLKEHPDAPTSGRSRDDQGFYLNVARCFADVADGLQYAHSKRIIHRDIKPSNLILDKGGRLRILDFGLARLEGQESLTISGDVVGTPLSMSPEQARRKQIPVDHRTEVYSLGATLYEMLTLQPAVPAGPARRGCRRQPDADGRTLTKYREMVKNKVAAYHRYVQLGCIAQGLLQYLSVKLGKQVWQHFWSWLRTMKTDPSPSEMVVGQALHSSLPHFLATMHARHELEKMIVDNADLSMLPDLRATG